MDKDKIINELVEHIESALAIDSDYVDCVRTDLLQTVVGLLKEQEAVEPKVEKAILDYQSWHYICGDCGGQIDINDNYCRHCGRVVAHLSNKI